MEQTRNDQNSGRNTQSGRYTYRDGNRDSGFNSERGNRGGYRGRGFGNFGESNRQNNSEWNKGRGYNTETRFNGRPDNMQYNTQHPRSGYNQQHGPSNAWKTNQGNSYVSDRSRPEDKNNEEHIREWSPDRNERARPKDKHFEDHARDPSPDRSSNIHSTQGTEAHGHNVSSPGGYYNSASGHQGSSQNMRQGQNMESELNKQQQSHGAYQGNRNYDHGNDRSQDRRHYDRKDDKYYEDWSQRSRPEKNDIQLSKALSFLLRHGAEKRGYKLMPGGFLYVDEILRYEKNLYGYTLEDIQRVVKCNDKQRFFMEQEKETGNWKIRANQGHTLEVENLDLRPLLSKDEASVVIHGTYMNSWESIKKTGLSKMGRNHIHFAAGEPGENGVISGMRKSCDVLIFVDLEKALADGFKFFWSANNVILCAGDKDGVIPPAYFLDVAQRQPRQRLPFEKTVTVKVPVGGGGLVPVKDKKNKKKTKGDATNEHETKRKHKKEKNEIDESAFEDSGIMFSEEGMDVDTKSSQVSQKEDPPSQWDDENSAKDQKVKDNDADVIVESREEILYIDDESISVSAIDYLQTKETVAVYCQQTKDSSSISKIMCVTPDKSYVFDIEKTPDIMSAGKLSDFFNSKDPTVKVFNGLDSKLGAILFKKFQIILDGTKIFDLKIAYDLMKTSSLGNMTTLKETKFDPDCVPTSDDDASSLNSLLLTYLAGYKYLVELTNKMKDYKKHLFDMVNEDIEREDLKRLKDQRKKENKTLVHQASETANVSKKNKGKKKK